MSPTRFTVLTLSLAHELSLVNVRRRVRDVARLVGATQQDQTRVATAVSEIARIAFDHAANAQLTVAVENGESPALVVIFSGGGGGFRALQKSVREPEGAAAAAVIAARSLVDSYEEVIGPETSELVLRKKLPSRISVTPEILTTVSAELARSDRRDPLAELHEQNRELSIALGQLQQREQELERINGELEDTNRGVMALYAELDDRAQRLREVNELKSRFLSYMSHEFRTPLSSILALSRLLLSRADGELGEEQEKQVSLIRDAANDLSGTVNDLLDLSKIEAGRLETRDSPVLVADLFSALRGMLRPLATEAGVTLIVEESDPGLRLVTDEAKLAQILRNLVSNAVKFTPRGEVRLRAENRGDVIRFTVRDNGIGIAPADLPRIFEEYAQLDSPVQRRVTGTGLGLPLCRKLAQLLGGEVTVESELGKGSTFSLVLPCGSVSG